MRENWHKNYTEQFIYPGNQSWIFMGSTDAEAETPILWPPDAKRWLIGKDPDAGKDWGQEEKGTAEEEMVGWHHRLDGHGFGWTPGVGDGQGGLACCNSIQFSSIAQSCPTLWPHESQHARPPCPSPTPRVHPNPCPSGRWCHPTISSSVVPFSSCPKSLPASGSFSMSQLFAWGGQYIGVSASTSVLPMNTQDWSPLGWTGWISLQSRGLSSLLQHHSSKASILLCSAFFIV